MINDETIEYIGILAKLELSAEEKEKAKQDMARMIEYIDKLKELDTTGIEPVSHIVKQQNVFREDVVTNGSGKQAYIEGYRVGGKTGTAQKFVNGQIAQGKYVSSFVGFFPANKPKYSTIVIVDEPTGQHYGSTVAAPWAKIIFQQIINYKNIQPVT